MKKIKKAMKKLVRGMEKKRRKQETIFMKRLNQLEALARDNNNVESSSNMPAPEVHGASDLTSEFESNTLKHGIGYDTSSR